jgi:GDPmannose 4,6-dehydratase
MIRRALITGITGQDGSYLADFLIKKGYEVHGVIRRSSSFNTGRLGHLYKDQHDPDARLFLHHGDMTDGSAMRHVLQSVQPAEIYNLAAQSHVRTSFDLAEYTGEVDAQGTLRLLEAVREYVDRGGEVRLYQAGSSEMYGSAPPPQNEQTRFHPRSPYAVSKVASHWYCVNYREAYRMFVANGILFNHESPRRGETFVTRKITRALTRIKYGLQDVLYLGNLEARRDWGFAGDYVEAMWLMLQHEEADDFVIATGESFSVQDFLDVAAATLDMEWKPYVKIDPRYFRPSEVDFLQGDASKARRVLRWEPTLSFSELVEVMVRHDSELAKQERTLIEAGHVLAARAAHA